MKLKFSGAIMGKKLIAIGELLIDFLGNGTTGLINSDTFYKNPGGAPANVAACVSALGGKSSLITKLGNDAFGDYLLKTMQDSNVNCDNIFRTNEANTPLAFVSLDASGERDFSFYRKPSSDLLLNEKDIKKDLFKSDDVLHFCSVDLVDYPVKKAHDIAIKYCLQAGGFISFDANLRYSLWESKQELLKTVLEYIPKCHILKVSEEELLDLTAIEEENIAVKKLFSGNVVLIIVTKGANGSIAYYKDGSNVFVESKHVAKVIDSTGAGDCFIGSFLYNILSNEESFLVQIQNKESIKKYLHFSSIAASLCIQKKGAINAMPLLEDVNRLMD